MAAAELPTRTCRQRARHDLCTEIQRGGRLLDECELPPWKQRWGFCSRGIRRCDRCQAAPPACNGPSWSALFPECLHFFVRRQPRLSLSQFLLSTLDLLDLIIGQPKFRAGHVCEQRLGDLILFVFRQFARLRNGIFKQLCHCSSHSAASRSCPSRRLSFCTSSTAASAITVPGG